MLHSQERRFGQWSRSVIFEEEREECDRAHHSVCAHIQPQNVEHIFGFNALFLAFNGGRLHERINVRIGFNATLLLNSA